jgi:presenilin-like A22 family membrane protease
MKHNIKVTIFVILLFLIAQLIGLNIISKYVNIDQTSKSETTVMNDLGDGLTPSADMLANKSYSIKDIWTSIYFILLIIIGTLILLLLIKLKLHSLWKFWFFFAVFIAMYKAIYPYFLFTTKFSIDPLLIVVILAAALSYLKNKQIWLHNFTEVLLYGGIAAILVPMLNLFSVFFLLLLISIYDMYAVWHSKHMITLAEFQSGEHMFAGLDVPYLKDEIVLKNIIDDNLDVEKSFDKEPAPDSSLSSFSKSSKSVKITTKTETCKKLDSPPVHINHAILGGGDIAFPLIFAGVVLKYSASYPLALIVVLGSTTALALLFFFSKKGRYYPAMPFISLGCVCGYLITLLF